MDALYYQQGYIELNESNHQMLFTCSFVGNEEDLGGKKYKRVCCL